MKFFWLIMAIILIIISNTSLKYYSRNKDKKLYFLSTILYIILIYCYAKVYENEDISTGFMLISVSALIGITTIGICILNEKTNNYKLCGIISSIVSMYLMKK